jgi:hypothetical protein
MRRLIVLAVLVAACNPYAQYCGEQIECEGGGDAETDECARHHDEADENAQLNDCGDYRESYFECVEQNSTCENGTFTTGTHCDQQRADLASCMP